MADIFAMEIRRNFRVLVVDDDEQVLSTVRAMVEKIGHYVVAQSDSQEALNLFQDLPDQFDIIFTDFQMPKINGIELSRAILKIRPEMPIILCTAYPDEFEDQNAKDVGIAAFLPKPFSTKDIVHIFEKVLQ